jgi:hypothetical protein
VAAFYSLYDGQSAPEFNMEEGKDEIHNYIDYFCGHQSGSPPMPMTEILIKS